MPARPSALAYRHARYILEEPTPAPQDEDSTPQPENAMLEGLAEEIMGLTISDEGPNVTSQPSRLWTSRQGFQQTRPSLERITNASLNAAVTETLQLMTSTGSSSNPSVPPFDATSQLGTPTGSSSPSVPPLHTQAPAPSSLHSLERQYPRTSATVEEVPDEEQLPHLATSPASSSHSSVLLQALPPSIPCPIQPQHTPDKMQLPRRLPRQTAAQKAIEGDLHTATYIALDLDDCKKMATLEPTSKLYC